MDLQRLRAELVDDPLARGYAGMSDAAAAASLNAADRTEIVRAPTEEIRRWAMETGAPSKWSLIKAAKDDPADAVLQAACDAAWDAWQPGALSDINMTSPAVTGILDIMIAGGLLTAAEKTTLQDMSRRAVSRAEELGLAAVGEGHVATARRV